MNNNYYEILEVDKNASPEIIEKAYKTLVKKYHPDLQDDSIKSIYEEKLKLINEAFDVLSDESKRSLYDASQKENTVSYEEYKNLYNENQILKDKLSKLNNDNNNNSNNTTNIPNQNIINDSTIYNEYIDKMNESINKAYNDAYNDAYIQDLKNRGYKIKYKKTLRDYLAILLTIVIIFLIFMILWIIPFSRNLLIKFYEENVAIQFIVNIISKFISAIN